VGGLKSRAVDVRFVAASNRDLESECDKGNFRRDLFYRLDTVQLRVPPLRQRPAEIGPLAQHFLKQACQQFGLPALSFSGAALEALCRHNWPGNIRHLRNLVERSALLGRGPVLQREDLGLPPPSGSLTLGEEDPRVAVPSPPPATQAEAPEPAARDEEESERERILDALNRCGGNQSRAAELLRMPRRTLVRKLGRYGFPRPRRPSLPDAPAGGNAA